MKQTCNKTHSEAGILYTPENWLPALASSVLPSHMQTDTSPSPSHSMRSHDTHGQHPRPQTSPPSITSIAAPPGCQQETLPATPPHRSRQHRRSPAPHSSRAHPQTPAAGTLRVAPALASSTATASLPLGILLASQCCCTVIRHHSQQHLLSHAAAHEVGSFMGGYSYAPCPRETSRERLALNRRGCSAASRCTGASIV